MSIFGLLKESDCDKPFGRKWSYHCGQVCYTLNVTQVTMGFPLYVCDVWICYPKAIKKGRVRALACFEFETLSFFRICCLKFIWCVTNNLVTKWNLSQNIKTSGHTWVRRNLSRSSLIRSGRVGSIIFLLWSISTPPDLDCCVWSNGWDPSGMIGEPVSIDACAGLLGHLCVLWVTLYRNFLLQYSHT